MNKLAYRSARFAVAALGLLALGGCLMFERPPAALTCDPDLVGRWIPLPSGQEAIPLKAGDHADVDAQCRVRLFGVGDGAPPEFDALGFRSEGQRYLALDRADLDGLFDASPRAPVDDKLPDTAVFLAKYRIDGEILEVVLPDMPYVVQEIESQRLPAREADTSVYLMQGSEKRLLSVLADHPSLFETFDAGGKPLRMRRAAAMERP